MTSTAASSSASSRHSASSSHPNRSYTARKNSPPDAALQSLNEPSAAASNPPISTSSSNALLASLPEMASSIFNTADAAQTAHRLSSNSDKFQITPYKNTNSSGDWLSAQTREILGPSNNIFSSGFAHPKKSPIYDHHHHQHHHQILVDSSQISSNESLLNARNPSANASRSSQSRLTPNNLNGAASGASARSSSSTKTAASASRQSLPSGGGNGGRHASSQPFTSKSITPPLTLSSSSDAASRINANRPSSTTFYPPYSSSSSSSLSQTGKSSTSPVKQAFNLNKSSASAANKLAQRRPIDASGLDLDEIFKVILGFMQMIFFSLFYWNFCYNVMTKIYKYSLCFYFVSRSAE